MKFHINPNSIDDYRRFMQVKRLPTYSVSGHVVEFPDEFAHLLGESVTHADSGRYEPSDFCFDYQADISRLAISKRKFAVFAECGLGKTIIAFEFANHAILRDGGKVLIVSPLMVVPQTITECQQFYGATIRQVRAAGLQEWLDSPGSEIGITNYEAMNESLRPGKLSALILDESSMLKSHYGKWGAACIRLGRGLKWKLALTGTPAPNDRIEYANHAVFLDAFRSTNEFLARYFVNRGQTQNRWELKPHALRPFYRDLSHWCIFLSDPSVYGWKDNCETIPPIHVHIEDVPMTGEQRKAVQDVTGGLFAKSVGGVGQRSKLGQIAKGKNGIATNKPGYIRDRVNSWPDESTIIWCIYNDEQDRIEAEFPTAAAMRGSTPIEQRIEMIDAFKAGHVTTLISKPKILGFGLNLQIATRQVFSGLQDSYEQFHQAVKRSNRIGSTRPLNVHIPVTDVEVPMVQSVLDKAHRIEADTREQESLFKEQQWNF